MNVVYIALGVSVFGFLAVTGLLIYQQHFYCKQIKELVEHLMARSLGEYERAKNPAPRRVAIPLEEPVENLDRIIG